MRCFNKTTTGGGGVAKESGSSAANSAAAKPPLSEGILKLIANTPEPVKKEIKKPTSGKAMLPEKEIHRLSQLLSGRPKVILATLEFMLENRELIAPNDFSRLVKSVRVKKETVFSPWVQGYVPDNISYDREYLEIESKLLQVIFRFQQQHHGILLVFAFNNSSRDLCDSAIKDNPNAPTDSWLDAIAVALKDNNNYIPASVFEFFAGIVQIKRKGAPLQKAVGILGDCITGKNEGLREKAVKLLLLLPTNECYRKAFEAALKSPSEETRAIALDFYEDFAISISSTGRNKGDIYENI